ncbi:hypothetical protein AWV79_13190 [Cupriavidus sp. UYMMa02A]|nr:hypothetical protein AWV79_13190 [Cupriavidus sp. UYMMa02A]
MNYPIQPGCGAAEPAGESPPMAPNRALLPDSLHHLPPGARALRATNPHQWLALTIGVRRKRALPGLAGLDPLLPAQRRYLSLKEIEDNYGSELASVTRIETFARAHRLVVTRDDRATATLELAGTVADVNAAFGVNLLDYTQAQMGSFHARTQEVSVPAEVQGDITGVFGLNNHAVLTRRPRLPTARRASLAQARRPWFVPGELAKVYGFPDAMRMANVSPCLSSAAVSKRRGSPITSGASPARSRM